MKHLKSSDCGYSLSSSSPTAIIKLPYASKYVNATVIVQTLSLLFILLPDPLLKIKNSSFTWGLNAIWMHMAHYKVTVEFMHLEYFSEFVFLKLSLGVYVGGTI